MYTITTEDQKIKIYNNNSLLLQKVLTEKGHQTIELDVALECPTKLIIEHYDKNMKYDTKLENGNIINDKGFILEKIHLNNFILENELYHFKFIKDNGEELNNNNYIGYNGKYIINIDSDELFTWYFKLQKSFINELENFAADVAHELKNPLASLKSSSELLADEKLCGFKPSTAILGFLLKIFL